MIMELTMIIASVAWFVVALIIGFVAGGVFYKIKQEYDEINKQIDQMNEIVSLLKRENTRLRTMNNHSAKTDDENKKDM